MWLQKKLSVSKIGTKSAALKLAAIIFLGIINYFLTVPTVWAPQNHTNCGVQLGSKCGFEMEITSAVL